MENNKVMVNVLPVDGKSEVIIRNVDTVNELPVKEPLKLEIKGTIDAVSRFLKKRHNEIDNNAENIIDGNRSTIYIDREKRTITLVANENDAYKKAVIVGSMQVHPAFDKFGINTEKAWEPNKLGQFFKMHRVFFADKTENMELVSKLLNFEAKVNSSIEKQKAENGSFADNYSGVVSSNLPGTFKVNIPVFKGLNPEVIDVEFYSNVNGRSVTLNLFSPGAVALQEDMVNTVIDEQITELTAFTNIVIVEV